MPSGQGWFLSLKTGRATPIYEHATAVLDNPRRFCLKTGDVSGLDAEKDRIEILRLVLRRGFCRVRMHQGVSLEFDFNDRRKALERIHRFLRRQGVGELEALRINDLRRGVGTVVLFRDLLGPLTWGPIAVTAAKADKS